MAWNATNTGISRGRLHVHLSYPNNAVSPCRIASASRGTHPSTSCNGARILRLRVNTRLFQELFKQRTDLSIRRESTSRPLLSVRASANGSSSPPSSSSSSSPSSSVPTPPSPLPPTSSPLSLEDEFTNLRRVAAGLHRRYRAVVDGGYRTNLKVRGGAAAGGGRHFLLHLLVTPTRVHVEQREEGLSACISAYLIV